MSNFSDENVNAGCYKALNEDMGRQLKRLGWECTFDNEGNPAYESPSGQVVTNVYDAWCAATDSPNDLHYGIDKEPPQPKYVKPV